MADKLDDAQDGGEDKPKLSFQEQMAQVKQKFGNSDSEANNGKSDDDTGEDDAAAKGAEGDDTSAGDGGANGDDTSDQSGSSDGDDDNGDSSGSGDEDKSFEGRFNQFKGDGTSDSYIKNLEDGYQNSSQEAIRLKDVNEGLENQVNAIKQAAAQDKEFGARLLTLLKGNGNGASDDTKGSGKSDDLSNKAFGDTDNPFLKDAETNWNKESESEAAKFSEANPEVLTDPKINADVKRWMRIFSNEAYEAEGRLMKAGEAMEKAYNHLGLENKLKTQGDLVNGMKGQAAPTRPPAKKPSTKSSGDAQQFSNLTLNIAQRMGISKERLAKSKTK